jgi:hypothetical protein
MLNALPGELPAAQSVLRDALADMSVRLQYVTDREGPLAPAAAHRAYDGYRNYVIPRIRGTFLLHQVRLLLGNDRFAQVMRSVHEKFAGKAMNTNQFVATASAAAGQDLTAWVEQWVNRDDLPAFGIRAIAARQGSGWQVALDVTQSGTPYTIATSVALETVRGTMWKPLTIAGPAEHFTWTVADEPRRIVFNPENDIPSPREKYYTYSNLFDDFSRVQIVYGTSRSIEANHTAALKMQSVLADQFTEQLLPVVQDAEVTDTLLATSDFLVLGGTEENRLTARLVSHLGLELGKNMFRWRGKTYAEADDGLFVVLPNPITPKRVLYLVIANSAAQQYQMTKRFQSLPSWAVWKGDQVTEKGYHGAAEYEIALSAK